MLFYFSNAEFAHEIFIMAEVTNIREEWLEGVGGHFKVPSAVLEGKLVQRTPISRVSDLILVLPKGSKVVFANDSGTSAWSKTGKLLILLENGETKRYFIKCATGKTSRALVEGE